MLPGIIRTELSLTDQDVTQSPAPARALTPRSRAYQKTPFLFAAVVGVLIVAAALRFVALDRYPLGWHHDEALMGVMADEVYRGVERPIFFRQYLGQEPLYIYLSAAAMTVFGDTSVLPLRATSAALGLLTVALTFALGRTLFGARVGLLAMALAATSFWQVMFSRLSYRSISQPLVEALAAYLFWKAYRRRSVVWFAAAGVALGATWYTYLGARGFVGVFAAFALWLLLIGRRPRSTDLRHAAVYLGMAALVVAPLAVFFLTNPGTFGARMGQVFIFRHGLLDRPAWSLFAENARNVAASFTFSGEPVWRYNLPGRAFFVGLVALGFYVGLVVLARRLWRRDDGAALVVAWLAVMLVPGLLSMDSADYNLRAMGLLPALFLVPALGLDAIGQWLARIPRLGPRVALAVLALVVVSDGVWTARDYFVVWAPSFGAVWEAHGDAVAQARFLVTNADPERENIYVGTAYYHHPDLAYLARSIYPSLRWFDGTQDVVFDPSATRPSLYVLALDGMPGQVDEVLPRADQIGEEDFPRGVDDQAPPPLYRAYRLSPDQVRAQVDALTRDPRLQKVSGRLPGLLTPIGARFDEPARPGENLTATFLWRVEGTPPPKNYQLAVQLVDHAARKIAGVEGLGYPAEEWRAGRIVWSQFSIPIPRDAAPGAYQVQWVLYDADTGRRVTVADGLPGVQALVLGDARIIAASSPPPPSHPIGARLGGNISLIGFDAQTQGSNLAVTLDWTAYPSPDRDYTVFVQLLNPQGKLVAQSDSFPASGGLPTSSWLPGETVLDAHHLSLPPGLPAGAYRLIAGMYLASTGQRLPVSTGGDFVPLETISLG